MLKKSEPVAATAAAQVSDGERLATAVERIERIEAVRVAAAAWVSGMAALAALLLHVLGKGRPAVTHQRQTCLQVWVRPGMLGKRQREWLWVGNILRLQEYRSPKHLLHVVVQSAQLPPRKKRGPRPNSSAAMLLGRLPKCAEIFGQALPSCKRYHLSQVREVLGERVPIDLLACHRGQQRVVRTDQPQKQPP